MTGTGYGTGDTGRDAASFSTPGAGTESMGDRAGSGEVHSGLHSGRSGGEELGALGFAEGGPSAGVKDRVIERARSVAGTVRDGAENLGHRAGEIAGTARDRLGAMSDRTNQALEQRGLIARLQENPLPALGVAFGLGFLLAGGGRSQADSTSGRLRRELRGALMAGLTAGAAQATRGFLQSAGRPEGALSSLFGGSDTTTGRGRGTGSGRMSTGLGSNRDEF